MPRLELYHSLRFLSLSGLLLAGQAYGAGFQLVETSVTGMGRATAGGSIAGDDLSAVHFNPADMMLLEGRKIQSGLSFVSVTGEIDAGGSRQIFPGPDGPVIAPTPGGTIDNGGTDAFVPNLYYVMDIDETYQVRFRPHGAFWPANRLWHQLGRSLSCAGVGVDDRRY